MEKTNEKRFEGTWEYYMTEENKWSESYVYLKKFLTFKKLEIYLDSLDKYDYYLETCDRGFNWIWREEKETKCSKCGN